ncbi:flagellar hook-length control protein FliK [Glaciecola sp. MF2-115]|uniref:flagellar hook-length control protein FliK n=1 Tax=Glaciecola sp. MF2-115 TaxID=3384827 RepID=UPI0039A0F4F5
MQQFASTQTSIAASKIPFEDVKQSSTNSSFAESSPIAGNSPKSAFEEALSQHEQSNQSAATRSRRASAESEKKLEQRNDQREASMKEQERLKETAENNKQLSSEQTEKDTNLKNDAKQTLQSSALADQGQTSKQNGETTVEEVALSADKKSLLEGELKSSNITDDFDWVSYVNKVKDLSSTSGDASFDDVSSAAISSHIIPNDLHTENNHPAMDIFAQTIASMDSANDALKDPSLVSSEILDAATDTEFLEISLSEQELAALINAAGGNSEEPASLNSEEMADLDKAIAKLLNQLVSKEEGDATKNVNEEQGQNADDANLLKDFLQASPLEIVDPQKVPMPLVENADVINENAEADKTLEELLLQEEVSTLETVNEKTSESDVSVVKSDEYLVPKPLESNDEQQSILAETEAQQLSANVSQALNQASDKTEKAPVAPLFVAVDKTSAKKQGELLAKLPPEAEASAIDNIATRVESVVTDLKAEGKSTEFIAALQSGVKEMKEQLKQGREPGIDLKTLVSDALAETDLKVSGKTEVALDKQLSQVTNILAAASSLNQSNQQQNYLNTGLNEVQGMKEITQQQIESTRLAQQTVVNEKAVNIFKPEGQQQLTEKVRWMMNTRNLSAEIRLDPPDLGGMNIKVNLSGDSATVNFVVQSQQAREALEQAVPRLREMLEEQGIELGQSSVQQDSSGTGQQSEQDSLANNSNASSNMAQQSQDGRQVEDELDLDANNGAVEQRISGGRIGGIDYYA